MDTGTGTRDASPVLGVFFYISLSFILVLNAVLCLQITLSLPLGLVTNAEKEKEKGKIIKGLFLWTQRLLVVINFRNGACHWFLLLLPLDEHHDQRPK